MERPNWAGRSFGGNQGSQKCLWKQLLNFQELTGKRHGDVIRDIRAMLDALEKDGSDLSHVRDDEEARHDSVRRTIETLATRGVITFPPLGGKSSTGGRPSTEFVFTGDKGRRDSIIVAAQLDPEFTATIVDRWQELEALYQPQQANPPPRPTARCPYPCSCRFSLVKMS